MRTSKTAATIQAYNKNADRYAEKFMDFKPYHKQMNLFERDFMDRDNTVLDLGCGPGNNARIILGNDPTYKVTGIDLSASTIDLARKNVPEATFQVQDIREITPAQQYDVILATFCIVHLTDSETISLLGNISAMLRDYGSLYLSFMEGKMPGFEKTCFSEDEIFFNYYNRNEIIELLAENGIATQLVSSEEYQEEDGSTTDDIFIFARKSPAKH